MMKTSAFVGLACAQARIATTAGPRTSEAYLCSCGYVRSPAPHGSTAAQLRRGCFVASREFFGSLSTVRPKRVLGAATSFSITAEAAPSLADLPFTSFLEEGLINVAEVPDAKAYVVAVFDSGKQLVHVGITRSLHETLRLYFGRQPEQSHFYKTAGFPRPSKTFLEEVAQQWLQESGAQAGDVAAWEHGLRAPLTADEEAALAAAGGDEAAAKAVLRGAAMREEAELKKRWAARGLADKLAFDPAQRDKGVLDVKLLAQPNKAMPKPPK